MKRQIIEKHQEKKVSPLCEPWGFWGCLWRYMLAPLMTAALLLLFCLPHRPSDPPTPVPENDTIIVHDTVVIRDTVNMVDTLLIRDTVLAPDTVIVPDTTQLIVQDSIVSIPVGDIMISLQWNNDNDVDLHCVEPSGEEIFHGNKISRTNGQLWHDAKVSSKSDAPYEYIYWPDGESPRGTYTIKVRFFSRKCTALSTPYVLKVKCGSQEMVWENSLLFVSSTHTYTFTNPMQN